MRFVNGYGTEGRGESGTGRIEPSDEPQFSGSGAGHCFSGFSRFGAGHCFCCYSQDSVPGVQFCNSATGFGKICCILEVNIWTFARSFTKKKTESQP